jgi:hypothetical protein
MISARCEKAVDQCGLNSQLLSTHKFMIHATMRYSASWCGLNEKKTPLPARSPFFTRYSSQVAMRLDPVVEVVRMGKERALNILLVILSCLVCDTTRGSVDCIPHVSIKARLFSMEKDSFSPSTLSKMASSKSLSLTRSLERPQYFGEPRLNMLLVKAVNTIGSKGNKSRENNRDDESEEVGNKSGSYGTFTVG